MKKNTIAIIPARGGSKRIPRKNIREFCGHPILSYPIRTALDSGLFARVIVSTDDSDVADVARHFGAEAVDRPPELADDHAPLGDVMAHEARRLEGADAPEFICFLLATAVFVSVDVLAYGAFLMQDERFDHALTAVPFPAPVQRSFVCTPAGGTRMLMPGMYSMRSQDLEQAYYDAGQCYWGRTRCFMKPGADYFNERTTIIPMDHRLAVDIDTPEDWEIAEIRYRQTNGNHA
jgi:N-acylneuraminate cytidylyltransferase